jgi:hypothetical protein
MSEGWGRITSLVKANKCREEVHLYMSNEDREIEKNWTVEILAETSRRIKADIHIRDQIARLVLHIGFACTVHHRRLYSASPLHVLHIASGGVTPKTSRCSWNYCDLRRRLVFVDPVIEITEPV